MHRLERLCGLVTMAEASVSVPYVCKLHCSVLETIFSGQTLLWENRALGNSLQPKTDFPTPTQNRPDRLEALVFVSLITSSDSALWAVWMAYPFSLPGSLSLLLHCEKIMARNLIWSQCQLPGMISASECELRVL